MSDDAAPQEGAGEPTFRRFEYADGKSSKFWEVAVCGTEQVVRYGRLGAKGQRKAKAFPSEAAARASAEKLIAQKTGKGYEETPRSSP